MEQDFYKRYQQQYFEPVIRDLSEAEQSALDYYLEGGKRHEVKSFEGIERRSDEDNINRLIPIIVGMSRDSKGHTPYDKRVHYFQDCAPMSKQEANALLDSIQKRLSHAEHTSRGNPERAVINSYETFEGYILEASDDQEILQQPIADPENPNIELMRSSQEILEGIAKQLMARQFLWDDNWPPINSETYEERHKYWLGFAVATSRYAKDDEMLQLHEFARKRAVARYKEWTREFGILESKNTPMIQRLREEGKLDPLLLHSTWQHKINDPEFHPEVPVKPEPLNEVSFDAMLPESIRPKVEAVRRRDEAIDAAVEAADDREFEKGTGRTNAKLTRSELKRRSVGRIVLTPEMKEEQDKAERAKIKKPQKPKRNPPTRYIGPRDTGPPLNIIRDIYPK
jgi:hypothetical protein